MTTPGAVGSEQRFADIWASPPGLPGWIMTVNSRPLGKRYMVTALLFFAVGVLLAVLMRTQLAVPANTLLDADTYNAVFTMHGSTMLYLFAVPFIEALGIYLIPLLIGSRDLAFPRLTNFGYWMYLFGGLTIYSSVLFGAVPDAGWTAYPPLAGAQHSGIGLDFWLLGLGMIEIAGITAAVELVATILKLRAPGMAVQHVPILVWAYLVTTVMIIFAFTPLLIATLLLEMDRSGGTHFFNPEMGGSSLLWQHLFWWFGHPEVYIVFLPATGVLSAIIPVLARRRLVAYSFVVAALIIIGFVSFGLWSHHMFTTGIPELPMHFFTAASYMIALASGVQVFSWIATLWGRRPGYSVQMLWVLGFFFVFVNGGLTGVMVATMSFDWQVHETNFVVAHFHHVLIGGAVFPFLAGLHHWLPKVTGRMFSELWAKLAFGLVFVGFNLTFVPMYVIGLFGMRRRVYTFPEEMGVSTLNLISSVGAYLLAAGFLAVLVNLVWHGWWGRRAPADPWQGGTLEWSVASPPPDFGFARPPVVRDRYPLWRDTAAQVAGDERSVRLREVAASLVHRPSTWRATLLTDVTNARPQVLQHLPGPTLLPFAVAVSILLAFASALAKSFVTAGIALLVTAVLVGRWVSREPDLPEEEAGLLAARLEVPLHGSGSRAIGWWGMVGLVAVLFTVLGSLLFSYFYLRLYSPEWPQGGLPAPRLGLAAAAAAAALAGGVGQLVSGWARRRARRRMLAVAVGAVALLGAAYVGLETAGLLLEPFAPTANAYASVFFVIRGFLLLLVVTAVALQVGTLVRLIRSAEAPDSPRLALWLQNAELFWLFTLAAVVLGFAVIYLVPYAA